jgi:hypothetical protein
MNYCVSATGDQLTTTCAGALWAMTVMMLLAFLIGLPRSLAAWRAGKTTTTTTTTTTKEAYAPFDNSSSGPV